MKVRVLIGSKAGQIVHVSRSQSAFDDIAKGFIEPAEDILHPSAEPNSSAHTIVPTLKEARWFVSVHEGNNPHVVLVGQLPGVSNETIRFDGIIPSPGWDAL